MTSTTLNRTASNQELYYLTIAALLSAIGILVPMFMPKIILGPMSFTLASHVAIFIAMFISPIVAVAVCICTTIGFFLTMSPIIALRAASHIIFALVGALVLKKFPQLISRPIAGILFGLGLAVLHATAEVVAVTPFFFGGALFSAEQVAGGYLMSVFVLVGCGTMIHSMIDYGIALVVWKPLKSVMRSSMKSVNIN